MCIHHGSSALLHILGKMQQKNKVIASKSKHLAARRPKTHKYITWISGAHRMTSKCASNPSSCSPHTTAAIAQSTHHLHINHLAVHGQQEPPPIRCGVQCQLSPLHLVAEIVVPWQNQISQSHPRHQHRGIAITLTILPRRSAADIQGIQCIRI